MDAAQEHPRIGHRPPNRSKVTLVGAPHRRGTSDVGLLGGRGSQKLGVVGTQNRAGDIQTKHGLTSARSSGTAINGMSRVSNACLMSPHRMTGRSISNAPPSVLCANLDWLKLHKFFYQNIDMNCLAHLRRTSLQQNYCYSIDFLVYQVTRQYPVALALKARKCIQTSHAHTSARIGAHSEKPNAMPWVASLPQLPKSASMEPAKKHA